MTTEDRSHLYPASFHRTSLIEAVSIATSLALLALGMLRAIPVIADSLIVGDELVLRPNEISWLLAFVPPMFLGLLMRRRKQAIIDDVEQWESLALDKPIRAEVSVKDHAGDLLPCEYVALITLWFGDSTTRDEADKFMDKIKDALGLFLKEAGRDPLVRRSPRHLGDWLNETFRIEGLRHIEVHSSKFRPVASRPRPVVSPRSRRPAKPVDARPEMALQQAGTC